MFGNKRRALEKRIANLESRIVTLETVRTPDNGIIPTSQLWKYINRFVKESRVLELTKGLR